MEEFSVVRGKETDLSDVIDIDYACYYKIFGDKTSKRDINEVKSYFHKYPNGFYVVKNNDNKNIGFIFLRIWGSVGWAGPLGVMPEYQNKGFGRMLFDKSFNFIESKNCKYRGFETIPLNIELFVRYGATPTSPTLFMKKNIIQEYGKNNKLIKLEKCRVSDYKAAIEKIANDVLLGLDLFHELYISEMLLQHEFIVIYFEDKVAGFFTAAKEKNKNIKIPILILSPCYKQKFDTILDEIENLFVEENARSIMFPVNCMNRKALMMVKGKGYYPAGHSYRMLIDNTDDPASNDEILIWHWGT